MRRIRRLRKIRRPRNFQAIEAHFRTGAGPMKNRMQENRKYNCRKADRHLALEDIAIESWEEFDMLLLAQQDREYEIQEQLQTEKELWFEYMKEDLND